MSTTGDIVAQLDPRRLTSVGVNGVQNTIAAATFPPCDNQERHVDAQHAAHSSRSRPNRSKTPRTPIDIWDELVELL